MAEIIRETKHIERTRHVRFFQQQGQSKNTGYQFECDEVGRLLTTASPGTMGSFAMCLRDPSKFKDRGVSKETWFERIPPVLACDCGVSLELEDPMTNRCSCGQLYNGSGQRLSHPSHWGEETGERFADDGSQILGFGENEDL